MNTKPVYQLSARQILLLSLATAIAGVLDGHDRLALIEAGYRNVRRFDWASTADGLVALYRTVRADGS